MNPLEAMIVLTLLIVALAVWGISFSSRDPTTPNPVSGQALSIETIIPADVLARVELLRAELEVIRFEMGQPKEQRPGITVTDVASREVIFQTFTLFRKANQLSFELTGHMRPELPITLPQNIRPLHVWRIVDAAYKCIILGKRSLGLTNHIEETRQGESVTSSDVFHAIGQANRQIDMLFRPRLSASDTFQQVVLATQYTARLLAQFPGATQMPSTPTFEHGKQPIAVYHLLAQCYPRIQGIAECSGLETLSLEIPRLEADGDDLTTIRPSDVYDLAILLVSELSYLHGQLKDTTSLTQSYARSLKVPAHVYQGGRASASPAH